MQRPGIREAETDALAAHMEVQNNGAEESAQRMFQDSYARKSESSNTPEAGVNPTGDATSMRAPGNAPPTSSAQPQIEIDPKSGQTTITTAGALQEYQGILRPEVDYSQRDKLDSSGKLIERDIAFSGTDNGYLLWFKNPDGGSALWAHVTNMVTKPAENGTFDTTISIANGSRAVLKSRGGKVLKWTSTCTFFCS